MALTQQQIDSLTPSQREYYEQHVAPAPSAMADPRGHLDVTTSREQDAKRRKYNLNMYGSETLTPEYTRGGELTGYQSGLTGYRYDSQQEALEDENLFRSNHQAWTDKWSSKFLEYDMAAGAPQVPTGPGSPGGQSVASADQAFSIPNRPPPAFETTLPATTTKPKPTRPVLTDELGALTSQTRPQAIPPASNPTPAWVEVSPVGAPDLSPEPGAPGAPSPSNTFDRSKVDAILDPLNRYANEIYSLSQDNTGLSVAEAQLEKAHELARQRSAEGLRSNQASALGQARSARNRGDRALLERGAIAEGAYLGSEAQRQQHMADRQLNFDLAELRAKEEDADRRFKLDALKAAGEMGLNTAALEVDIGKVDLAARREDINNQLQLLLQQNAISNEQYLALVASDDKKMQSMLAYSQAMAALQYEYEKLAVDDQNFADQILMSKYGIDKQTMVALKQIKEANSFQWDEILASFAGGAGEGGTAGLFAAISGGGGATP